MRAKLTILIVLGLLLLVGYAAATDISQSTVWSSNPGWMVANYTDSVTWTVLVKSPTGVVQGANVSYTVDPSSPDQIYGGEIDPDTAISNANGFANFTFGHTWTSGILILDFHIAYNDGTVVTHKDLTLTQDIDHDVPTYWSFTGTPSTLPVGGNTTLIVYIFDESGNRVDNKNPAFSHMITLINENPDGGSGLWDGSAYVHQVTLPTDANGMVSVPVRVSNNSMTNVFALQPIGQILTEEDMDIQGISVTAVNLTQTYPFPNWRYANNADTFGITYTLTDSFGNPVPNANISISASNGMSGTFSTNSNGQVGLIFGPTTIAGIYNVTATSVDNPALSCSQQVNFINTDPVALSLSVSPQGIPSLDVDGTSKAVVTAQVADAMGNPVIGQTVSFSILNLQHPGGPYTVLQNASLQPTTALTGGTGGYAQVNFIPEQFATSGQAGFNSTATGQCVVRASWTNPHGTVVTQDVTVVWKNYPYLNIVAAADNATCIVGQKINLTLSVTGNGTAIQKKPIEAELVMDVSGSMGSTPQMNGSSGMQYKLYYAKLDGTNFINKMNPSTDKLGLVAFQATASVLYSMSPGPFTGIKMSLNNMTSGGNTNTRTALKLAIEDLIQKSTNPNSVKAIILLTDGAYNSDGDPLARRTGSYIHISETQKNPPNQLQTYSWNDGDMAWYQFPSFTQAPSDQNLAKYANEHNIRIFPITLGTDDEIQPGYSGNGSSEWQIYNTMDLIASETNGTHYAATDGDQLGDVYTAIAGQLNQVAGGSTTVDLNMSTFNFFDHVATNLTNFLDYVPIGTSGFPGNLLDSTHIVKFNGSSYSYSGFPYTQNDQQNWTAKDMKYNVGNINLNDTWGIRFTFNVTNPGKITLFGPDSPATVTFQDSSTTSTTSAFINQITLPCQDSVVNGGFSTHHISVDNLSQVAGANQNPNIWTIQWNTTYDGTDSNVDEQISYWGQDGIEHIVPNAALLWVPKGNEVQQSFTVDATDPSLWPNNQVITIKVKAWASDTGEDHDTIQIYKAGANAPNYIKLQ